MTQPQVCACVRTSSASPSGTSDGRRERRFDADLGDASAPRGELTGDADVPEDSPPAGAAAGAPAGASAPGAALTRMLLGLRSQCTTPLS